MPSFFPQDTESEYHQRKSSETAQQPALQTVADDESQTKRTDTAAMEIIFPTHAKTPPANSMQGVHWFMKLTA